MNILRWIYYTYLVFLPTLAVPSLVGQDLASVSWIWFVFIFLSVVVFLDIAVEVIPFPHTLVGALATVFLVPIQILFALFGKESLWVMFAYQFLIEAAGGLIGIALYGLFLRDGHKGDILKKIAVCIGLLILPAISIAKLFGPVFGQLEWGWRGIFLVTALLSSIVTYVKRMIEPRTNHEDLWCLIIPGLFGFLFLAPFLYHLIDGKYN